MNKIENKSVDAIDVSVIITVFNIENYISDCIDSILSERNIKIEVICIDDCSTDNSYKIIKEYEKIDSRVKCYQTKHNSGLASARNMGIRIAKGRYFYNIDGDDKIVPNALTTMFNYMKKYDLDMLSFSAYSFYENDNLRKYGDEREYIRKNEYPGICSGIELFTKLMKNDERVNGNMVLYCFNTEFFKSNNLFLQEGLRYCDDKMFCIYMKSNRVACINEPLYLRRYREGSVVTSPMRKEYLESLIRCLVSELFTWWDTKTSDEANYQIERYFDERMREILEFDLLFKNDLTKMQYLENEKMASYFYKYFIKKKSFFSNYLTSCELDMIRKSRNVLIYGTGNISVRTSELLESLGIFDFSYVLTKKIDQEKFRGRDVMELSELDKSCDYFFVIATSKKYQDEIKDSIIKLGYNQFCFVNEYK